MAVPGMFRAAVLPVLVFCLLSFGGDTKAQLTLEIPEEEFEAAEDYKPIPPPSMDIDLTGTLPEAVLESMLGKTPYDFLDVVWGMEVTGNWTDTITGTGTLQVTDFTEGRGASTRIDPERYTGQQGFRMYNARLQSDGGHVYRLFAAFPPDHGGVAFGTELDGVKSLFEVLLCHMFEPDRRGCIDYPDEYYETELPELSKLYIMRKGNNAYKIEFAARVRETRTHRERGYSSTDMTGRIGDVRGWVCDTASWEEDPDACAAPEPLTVTSNSPPDGRENVHLATPQIEIKFNFPVDAVNLDQNFSLTTRDIRGEHLEMTGRIVPISDAHFRFKPDHELESGVIYEARIEGGKDGVESRNGATMTSSAHWWRFTTLVDLDNHGGPVDEPLRSHVYQTVRDAPLVVDKPALQRIHTEWEPHRHIHEGWQPESYPAELEISVVDQGQWRIDPQAGGSIDGNVVRVVRNDILEQEGTRSEIERQARNTINVYGWTPDLRGGTSKIETRLTPHDPYPHSVAAQYVIAEREVQHWHTDPAPLVFRYTFLQVGSWAEGVPEAEMRAAKTVVRMAEEFVVQLMPVRESYGIDTMRDADRTYANIHRDAVIAVLDAAVQMTELQDATGLTDLAQWVSDNSPEGGVSWALELNLAMNEFLTSETRKTVHLEALKNTIRAVREDLGGFGSGNDILVVFYPPDFYGPGQSFDQTLHSDGRHGVGMPITLDRSPSALAEGLVHEFAHYFGLPHRPGNNSEVSYDASQFSDGDFDGFRLALDGMSGHNKSSLEGNGEHPATLAPLMWPRLLERKEVFVSRAEYMSLMRAFATR